MKITAQLLEQLTGGRAKNSTVDDIADAMNVYCPQVAVVTPVRMAHFLAQVCHESTLLSVFVENLNYSEAGLLRTFRKYFTPTQAKLYAKRPEAIANRVYANRMGNGNEASGDGYKYRGRGLLQLTGRATYRAVGKKLGLPLEAQPDLSSDPVTSVRIACEYWRSRGINQMADADDGTEEGTVKANVAVTKAVNGGRNGLDDRLDLLIRAKKLLGGLQRATLFEGGEDTPRDEEAAGAPDLGPDEVILTPSSPLELISSLQKLLNEKNYAKLNPDGDWGQLTSMGVLAMQEANDLPLNGAAISFEDAKAAKVFVPEARKDATITEIRATDTEAKKDIKKTDVVEAAGYAVGGVVAGEKVGFWDGITGWIDKLTGISGALEPLSGLGTFLQANWGWVLVGGAGVAIFMARQSKWSILEAFKRGD